VTRDYELGFILTPEVNEEQTRALVERVEQIATTNGGQVVRVNPWGRRRLSYPIQHHRDGIYVFVDMILTPETVKEIDRTLKVSEEVMRHLIKLRDHQTVVKEREAKANAPAQAEPVVEGEPTEEISAEETGLSADVESDVPVISADEDEFVPPAIEEEAVEA